MGGGVLGDGLSITLPDWFAVSRPPEPGIVSRRYVTVSTVFDCVAATCRNSALYSLNLPNQVSDCAQVSSARRRRRDQGGRYATKELHVSVFSAAIRGHGSQLFSTCLGHDGEWIQGYNNPTGTFEEFEVFNHSILPNPHRDGDNEQRRQNAMVVDAKTRGPQTYTCRATSGSRQPDRGGASRAAHAPRPQPDHVTSGTITEYEADCRSHVYTFVPGRPAPTLIDPGHGHVHIIRNEGSFQHHHSVQLVPYDPNKRIAGLTRQPRRTAPNPLERTANQSQFALIPDAHRA